MVARHSGSEVLVMPCKKYTEHIDMADVSFGEVMVGCSLWLSCIPNFGTSEKTCVRSSPLTIPTIES